MNERDASAGSIINDCKKRKRVKKKVNHVSLQEAIQLCNQPDPKFDYYLEPEVADTTRNIIWSAVMFYVARPPKSVSPTYANVAGALNPAYIIGKHGTAAEPVEIRLGSSKQISHLLWFLGQHRASLFADAAPAVRMHARIDGGEYFPVYF